MLPAFTSQLQSTEARIVLRISRHADAVVDADAGATGGVRFTYPVADIAQPQAGVPGKERHSGRASQALMTAYHADAWRAMQLINSRSASPVHPTDLLRRVYADKEHVLYNVDPAILLKAVTPGTTKPAASWTWLTPAQKQQMTTLFETHERMRGQLAPVDYWKIILAPDIPGDPHRNLRDISLSVIQTRLNSFRRHGGSREAAVTSTELAELAQPSSVSSDDVIDDALELQDELSDQQRLMHELGEEPSRAGRRTAVASGMTEGQKALWDRMQSDNMLKAKPLHMHELQLTIYSNPRHPLYSVHDKKLVQNALQTPEAQQFRATARGRGWRLNRNQINGLNQLFAQHERPDRRIQALGYYKAIVRQPHSPLSWLEPVTLRQVQVMLMAFRANAEANAKARAEANAEARAGAHATTRASTSDAAPRSRSSSSEHDNEDMNFDDSMDYEGQALDAVSALLRSPVHEADEAAAARPPSPLPSFSSTFAASTSSSTRLPSRSPFVWNPQEDPLLQMPHGQFHLSSVPHPSVTFPPPPYDPLFNPHPDNYNYNYNHNHDDHDRSDTDMHQSGHQSASSQFY